MRCVLVEQELQCALGFDRVGDDRAATEHHHTGILDAEFQRLIGGEDPSHLMHPEADVLVELDV